MSFITGTPYYSELFYQGAASTNTAYMMQAITVPGRYKFCVSVIASTAAAVGAGGQQHQFQSSVDKGDGQLVIAIRDRTFTTSAQVSNSLLEYEKEFEFTIDSDGASNDFRLTYAAVVGQASTMVASIERIG